LITDRIFGEDCQTIDVYGARTKEIVASAVRGFNGMAFIVIRTEFCFDFDDFW